MDRISVLLADDHDLFCEGLLELLRLRPELEVVGRASDGAEAIAKARELRPEVILMDVRMPKMSGSEATRVIKTQFPNIRILMLTMSEDDADLFAAIKNGAQGYLLKNTTSAELVRHIRGVMNGEAAISGTIAAKMISEIVRSSQTTTDAAPEETLSEREQEVLQCVAAGLSNRGIAERLVISESTVKKHLRNILAKLHVENRVQAAMIAHERQRRQRS